MCEYSVTVIEYGAVVTLKIRAMNDATACNLALRTEGVTHVLKVAAVR